MADEVSDVFDSLFARNIQTVKATRDVDDDIALAGDMITTASTLENKALAALIYERVHALTSSSPEGFEIAIDANTRLAALMPDKKLACTQRVSDLRRLAYLRAPRTDKATVGAAYAEALASLGDAQAESNQWEAAVASYRRAAAPALKLNLNARAAIKEKLDVTMARVRLEKKIASLKSTLDSKPNDRATAKELTLLYLSELNDSDAASTAALQAGDPQLLARVKLMAKPVTNLTELEALSLGDWARSLASTASPVGKPRLLFRAHQCYQVFLREHDAIDLSRTKVEVAMRNVEKSLNELGLEPLAIDAVAKVTPEPARPGVPDLGSPFSKSVVALFDGKSFDGWSQCAPPNQSKKGWSVEAAQGVLRATGRNSNWLESKLEYKDFVLDLEWRLTDESILKPMGGGVVVRVKGFNATKLDPGGVEVDLTRDKTGRFTTYGFSLRRGSQNADATNNSYFNPLVGESEKPIGQWNKTRIECIGQIIRVYNNGVKVNEANGALERAGTICLRSQYSAIEYRNISLISGANTAASSSEATSSSSETDELNKGLIAHWTFDDISSGKSKDASGKGKGLEISSASETNGVHGKAIQFNAKNDFAKYPELGSMPQFTIAGWIKFDRLSAGSQSIMHSKGWREGDVHFHIRSNGTAALGVFTPHNNTKWFDLYSKSNLDNSKVGQWHHVAAYFSTAEKRAGIYLNGRLDVERKLDEVKSPPVLRAGTIGIWDARPYLGGSRMRRFQGSIDDLRVYNRVLCEGEAQALITRAVHESKNNPNAPSSLRGKLFEFGKD